MASQDTDQVYESAGFGKAARRGARPAVLVVDFSYGFTDPAYPTGADMSASIAATRVLLDAARLRTVPIVFTKISYDEADIGTLPWLRKAPGLAALRTGSRLAEIDERLARRAEEPLISKIGASAFFGTSLVTMLTAWSVDTLIVTGATTSGCVRASVVDAVQSGYDVLIPKECVADRASGPHEANLFDMQQKYGDVIPVAEAIRYVRNR